MPPFAECVVFIELDNVYWYISPYGIVISATAAARVYFTFGDLFENYVNSQEFSPYATVTPLHMFHEGILFPLMPDQFNNPPILAMPQNISESDPPTPTGYFNSHTPSSRGSNPSFEALRVTPIRMVRSGDSRRNRSASTSRNN